MSSIKTRVVAAAAAVCTALGVGLAVAPEAQASDSAVCMKNVTTSDFYFTVQFHNMSTFADYNDAINLGEISGECGTTNVFSEPIKFRVPPGNHARFRTRGGDCGATVAGAWSGYYNAPENYYPNGRWVNYVYTNTVTGTCTIWETEMKSGLT